MSYSKGKTFQGRGLALTVAVHTILLSALLAYRPLLPVDQVAAEPLRVTLLANPPVATPPVPPPVLRVVEEPLPARRQALSADREARRPEHEVPGAPGGGRPERADRTLALLPWDVPVLLGATTLGSGVGDGLGDGRGSGTGSGPVGVGLGSGGGGGGGVGGEPPLEPQFAEWIVKPDHLVPRYYPEDAKEKGSSGTVMLTCLVDEENRVHRCKVLKESPRFVGFGKATLRLSKHFRVKPPMVGGMPRYDVPVRIPVVMEYR